MYIGRGHLSPLQSRHLGTSHTSPSISSTGQNRRNYGTNFATTRFMPRPCIKISDTVVFESPVSFWFSHCQMPIFAACSPYTVNILRCSACCRPSRMWVTFNRLSTTFEPCVPHFYFCSTHCIVSESLLNHLNSFRGGLFKLNTKSEQIHCSTHSVVLNVTATQDTCSLNGVYHPH